MLMPSILRDDLFDNFFDGFMFPEVKNQRPVARQSFNPMRTDVRELEGSFELDIDLPGYKKEDVELELKEGYLTIRASQKSETKEEKDGKYIRQERFYGSASRSFYVGEEVTENDITARFREGILSVNIPKKEPVIEEPKRSFITISD